jgi:hypothetical protein
MAQKVNPTSIRLGLNQQWTSQWFATKDNYAALFFEDQLITTYLTSIFENRGYFVKRVLIKRSSQCTMIFAEVYANPYFKYTVPKDFRHLKVFQRRLQLKDIRVFLQKNLVNNKVYLSIYNLFMINRLHRTYMSRLRNSFYKFKKFRFTATVLGIFNIVLRTKGAFFLARIMKYELEFLEKKKKNKTVWRFIAFIKKLGSLVSHDNKAIHGLRIQLKGRFKGMKRPKRIRVSAGMVPFNTLRALIDYAFLPAITVNGAYGIKIWICYK